MNRPLRLLIVEDSPDDAEIMLYELRRGGFAPTSHRVETEEEMRAALEQSWNIILADYNLPSLTGREALSILKESGKNIPFIIVSGVIRDDVASDVMKEGATDYIPKASLVRLPAVVERELREAEQRRIEQAVQNHKRILESILESMLDGVVVADAQGKFLLFNPAAERILGQGPRNISPAEWSKQYGLYLADKVTPYPTIDLPLAKALRGERVDQVELFVRHARIPQGAWLSVSASPLQDEAGNIRGGIAVFRDVSEQKTAQEAHARLEQERDHLLGRLRLQIERMPIACILLDTTQHIRDWNPAAEKIFGYAKEEALEQSFFDLIVTATAREYMEHIQARLLEGDMFAHSTNENKTKDGRTILCEWYNTPLIAPNGSVDSILSMAIDVTKRHQIEQQYHQAQKMEAIGRLAGGVAHDFNNMLTVIEGYSDLILRSLHPKDPMLEMVTGIKKAAEQSASLTQQLLAFSRRQVIAPKILDLNQVVREIEKMLGRIIGEDIDFKTTLQSDLWKIRADRGQMAQVLLNLAINARDAMPMGGRLVIKTANMELDEDSAQFHVDMPPGPYVVLTVKDSGHGMTTEVMNHIFEPFFTTKEPHKGTGLGLAVVHGIITQSKGFIHVQSQPAMGTTIQIFLPHVDDAATAEKAPPSLESFIRGTETIMLVEDEPAVRDLVRRVLQENGYLILEASNAGEAYYISLHHTGPIHLLITDVVMPGPGGRKVAELLLERYPDMRVLYMSGYPDDAMLGHGLMTEEVNFMPKPFSLFSLVKKIREVLDAPK